MMMFLVGIPALLIIGFIGATFVYRNNPSWLFPEKKGKALAEKLVEKLED